MYPKPAPSHQHEGNWSNGTEKVEGTLPTFDLSHEYERRKKFYQNSYSSHQTLDGDQELD